MLHGLDLLRRQYVKLSTPQGGAQTPEDTIKVLAERLEDASVHREDARAAVLSLKALSRDHAVQVGEHALRPLIRWIQRGGADEEALRAAVECCLALCQAPAEVPRPARERALTHMDSLLAEQGALLSVLALLGTEHGFYTRFAALQLLATLLEHRRQEVQEHVLVAPGGCSAVLRCLEAAPNSSTEIIRNETLLLLPHLVSGSADIQKLIAFEGAFERLLDIVAQEGRIEGGVVVQDALDGLESLLQYNVSNQNYFRETLSIPLLAPLLFFPPALPVDAPEQAQAEHAAQRDAFLLQEWDEQKLVNALVLLRIVKLLVDGQGEGHKANRLALLHAGMTECLAQLALASMAPPLLKAHALALLAHVLRGSRLNQERLAQLVVTPVALVRREQAAEGEPQVQFAWQPPQPVTLCLVTLALRGPGATAHERQALAVRVAALAAFEALTEQNVEVRMTVLHALVAAPPPDQGPSAQNQLLLENIAQLPTALVAGERPVRFDAYQYLFASLILSRLLQDSGTAKQFVRHIYMDEHGRCVAAAELNTNTDDDDAPTRLIHLVLGNLAMAFRELGEAVRRERAGVADAHEYNSATDWTRVTVGYLVLLCHWLWESPESIADLVSESANVQVLIQPVAQSLGVDPVIQGLAAFVLGVAYEFNEVGVKPERGEQRPDGAPPTGAEDAAPDGMAPGAAAPTPNATDASGAEADTVMSRATMHSILHSRVGADQFAARLVRIKNDRRFADCEPDVLERFLNHAALQPEQSAPPRVEAGDADPSGLWFDWPFVEFWKENYVRVQKSILVEPHAAGVTNTHASAELLDARQKAESLALELQRTQHELEHERGQADYARGEVANLYAELEKLRGGHGTQEAERFRGLMNEAQAERDSLRAERESLQGQLAKAKADYDALQSLLTRTQSDHDALQQQLASIQADRDSLQSQQVTLQSETAALQSDKAALQGQLEARPKQDAEPPSDVESLRRENEDLLVLLDELTVKRSRDKALMRQHGWEVSEDEDDDDE